MHRGPHGTGLAGHRPVWPLASIPDLRGTRGAEWGDLVSRVSRPRTTLGRAESLWRRVVRALAQVLACLAHRDTRPAGGSADVGDRRVRGVLPEIVGLPRGDLIEQVRSGPALDARCSQYRVPELRVL